jgi:hypothetical protein
LQLINPSTSPNELNTTLTPHNIIHGDACFAYFNKIWGIPMAAYGVGGTDKQMRQRDLSVNYANWRQYWRLSNATEALAVFRD